MGRWRRLAAAAAVIAVGLALTPAGPAHAAGLTATFTKTSDWGTGYEGKYTIVNGTTAAVTWRVEFDLPTGATISSFWDASLTRSGNHVVAVGTWNATLAVGASTSFGWIGAPGGVTPANCTVNGGSCAGSGGGDTTPPTVPGTLSSPSRTTTTVSLSWGASTDTGGSGLAGYNIYRNGATTPTAQTNGTGTTFTDSGLVASTTYTYVVRARDGAGNVSGPSNQISVTTNAVPTDTTPPTTPGTLSSPSRTASTVNLSWGASTDTGGSGLAGYNIYRNSTGPGSPTYQTTGTGTTFTATGLSANTTYTFVVRARDGAGNISGASNQISVTTNQVTPGTNRRVAYFTQWGIYERAYFVKNIDTSGQAAKLTHIHYAFGNVNAQSRCFQANQLGQGDAWADYQRRFTADQTVNGTADVFNQPLAGNFNQLKELKAKHPGLKVLISIGGWTYSRYFSDAALTAASRQAMVASCLDLYIKGNLPQLGGDPAGGPGSGFGVFDGVDIDWEWPASEGNVGNIVRPQDKQNYSLLLAEFRRQLDALTATTGKRYLLTAFTPADPAKIAAGWDITRADGTPSVFDYMDFGNVQGYDFHGAGSDNSWEPGRTGHQANLVRDAQDPYPFEFSIQLAIQTYLNAGVNPRQLTIGFPFYGRGWQGVAAGPAGNGEWQTATGAAPGQFAEEAGTRGYNNLLAMVPNCTVHHDTQSVSTYCYTGPGGQWWTYDDPWSIGQKTTWLKQRNLLGAMIWEMSGDTTNGSLMTALHNGL